MRIVCVLVLCGFVQGQLRLDPLVNTKLGLIRGLRPDDGDYSMFLGIPYAKVNEDNPFGTSIPHPKFDEIYEANDDSPLCPQIDEFNKTAVGQLDCLRLNIFVPNNASSSNKLPVLIWIHGGALAWGAGNRYVHGGKFLVQHDVILVSVSYRLGPYGFMCLNTPDVPGNQGVKDQALAMRWVKDNIASFGGDVNKITAMGESAGASAVEYHLYSNQEKLFNQAIIQSGSVFTAYVIRDANPSAPSTIARHLGYETEDISDALNFLRDVDPKLVIAATTDLGLRFRVCVEKEFDGVESFLTEYPLNLDLPKIRNMSVLAGLNSRERLMTHVNRPASYYKNLNLFHDSLKVGFNYDYDFLEMENIVRRFYIGDEEISEHVRSGLTDFSSDMDFDFPAQRSFKRFLENDVKDVFYYIFSYSGGRNYNKTRWNVTEDGAAHQDEIGYLFDQQYDKKTPTADDQLIIDRITRLWTNFVKYGDPTPETTELLPVKWIPITKDIYHYLDIDKELALKRRPFHARMAFLELFYKFNEKKLKGYREK